jgi:hypothetical protein
MIALLLLLACGDDGSASDGGVSRDTGTSSRFDGGLDASLGGFGDPCSRNEDCRAGFDCSASMCTPNGSGAVGSPCTYTAECMMALYCAPDRRCAMAGTGVEMTPCATTADCAHGFVCDMTIMGRVCTMAGTRDVGGFCASEDDCIAGLFCIDGRCAATETLDGGMFDAGDGCDPDGGMVACNDGDLCTFDTCIADMCLNRLIDGDEDGYAPDVIGACGLDCADEDPAANPDQTEYFPARHMGGADKAQPETFDWNCDGIEEQRWPSSLPPCMDAAGVCAGPIEGWLGAVPPCGTSGDLALCTPASMGCRQEIIERGRVQTCR